MGVCILLGMYIMSAGDTPTTTGATTTNTTTTTVNTYLFSVVNNNNGRQFSNDANTTTANVNGDRSQAIFDTNGNIVRRFSFDIAPDQVYQALNSVK